jgi:hypothetical protein
VDEELYDTDRDETPCKERKSFEEHGQQGQG